MRQPIFKIFFAYELIPDSVQINLSADIEMVTGDLCLVHNVQRVNTNESSLLPLLELKRNNGTWVHADSGRESDISKAIGEGIVRHLDPLKPDQQKFS